MKEIKGKIMHWPCFSGAKYKSLFIFVSIFSILQAKGYMNICVYMSMRTCLGLYLYMCIYVCICVYIFNRQAASHHTDTRVLLLHLSSP